jgi:hypothetical protein
MQTLRKDPTAAPTANTYMPDKISIMTEAGRE